MIELSGELWVTGDPRGRCSLRTDPLSDTFKMEDLDSETEELLRESPEPWTPPTQHPRLPGAPWSSSDS